MRQSLFVGVDGGATKCIVRVEDDAGNVLGREVDGPANIRLSVTSAWMAIHAALNKILHRLNVRLEDGHYALHAGMGLAGCEIATAYQDFIAQQHAFCSLAVVSDAHTACLGAHGGDDGSIIVVGTGVVGYQVCHGRTDKVSGWGFPQDDIGSGAWIGLQAVQLTWQALDGRMPASPLTESIFAYFTQHLPTFIDWAHQARSTDYAMLAPLVIEKAQQGELTAIRLLQQAANAIDRVGAALAAHAKQDIPCALVGGIAPFLQPYLSPVLQARLRLPLAPPDAGAILLIREHVAHTKETK